MKLSFALRLLSAVVFICLLPVEGWSAGDNACLQEEQRLQTAAAQLCSGLSYILNPNACFKARKALASFNKEKCRETAGGDGTQGQQAKPVSAATVTLRPEPARVTYIAAEIPGQPQLMKVTPVEATTPLLAIDQLRSEVSELKEELWRLQEEVARLKACQ